MSSQFWYGPDRQRFKQVAAYSGSTETTHYVGGILEKRVIGSSAQHRHLIAGPDGLVAIYTRHSSGTPSEDTYYVTRDHLGSVDTVTDASGAVQVRLSYDAFGKRRKEAAWSGALPAADWTAIAGTSRRGYTEHEHLDNLGLIHMNGRVQDPQVGRFLSADPFVPDPGDGQSFNRYSYVRNNPLTRSDPTGFCDNPDGCPPAGPGGRGHHGRGLTIDFSMRGAGYGNGSLSYTPQHLAQVTAETGRPPGVQAADPGRMHLDAATKAANQAAMEATGSGAGGVTRSHSIEIYVRSFASFKVFGGGFAGDDRSFSTDLNVTSRISGRVVIDLVTGEILAASAVSSPSRCIKDPCLAALKGWGRPTEAVEEPSIRVSRENSTYVISLTGSNPLFAKAADLDLELTLTIGSGGISGTLVGDAFPSAEVFAIGPFGATMLHKFETPGDAVAGPYRFLPGDFRRPMGKFGSQ